MGHATLRARRARSGISLVEIAITIAIAAILAAIGAGLMTGAIPSWRTREAAYDFAAVVNLARNKAIADGFEYRVRIVTTDPNLDDDIGSVGVYTLERGNQASASDVWDILPVDDNGPDTDEGTYDISMGGDEQLRDVSISPSGSTAVDGDDILISPRGWVANPDSDFDASGHITVTFTNKRAHLNGTSDERYVQVSRSGMVRILSDASSFATGVAGTTGVSNTAATAGTGYAGSAPPSAP